MQRYARWEDAMIAQTRLYEYSWSDVGLRYLQAFFGDMNARSGNDTRDVRGLVAIQVRTLRDAEPVYVSGNAADVIDHARESWQIEPALPGDPFVPEGFVLLPRPIDVYDAPPTDSAPLRSPTGHIPVRAIAWTSVHAEDLSIGSFWISYYVDVEDEIEQARAAGVPSRWELPNAPEGILDEMRRIAPLSLVHMFQWQWGANPLELEAHPVDGETIEETERRAREQVALVQTLWRIGSQFLPARHQPPRQVWRQANRRGIDKREVNVITLRRSRDYQRPEEGSGRTLGVQHPVRGYWGRRHTVDGVKQVWVAPYIRGGDDLPWQDSKDRAWEFTR